MKRSAQDNCISGNNSKKLALDFDKKVENVLTGSTALDTKYLGGGNFISVNHFLGQTRVHIRRHVFGNDDLLHPTKDGVSLTPLVWYYLRRELRSIRSEKLPKVFVIQRDLCISKQIKDGEQIYIFQRFFQRKNLSMNFIPEFVVLKGVEFGKLCEYVSVITDRVQDGLVTYSLSYHLGKEVDNLGLKPVNASDPFLELLESLSKCLCVAIALKITELINCAGCRDNYESSFMHECVSKSRADKYAEYFDQALCLIDMKAVAKDIVQKNITLDFNYVLGQEEFFDALDVKGVFKSIKKMYIGEEETMYNELMISCN